MFVTNPEWQAEIAAMCDKHSDGFTRAKGHNYKFDALVSDRRRHEFETFVPQSPAQNLHAHHVEYWQERCRHALVPATFMLHNDPASPSDISDELVVARLENIDGILTRTGKTIEQLQDAKSANNYVVLEEFVQAWNRGRDHRPHFAAVFDDVKSELAHDDWPNRLRDRLGLAHYSANSKAIPVVLMVYPLGDMNRNLDSDVAKMTTPTVLDSEPWPYFYPAPKSICYGRAMTLDTAHDESGLQAELLHPKSDYKVKHLFRFGKVDTPIPPTSIEELRNHHLLCLRVATGEVSFGCEL